MDSSAADAAIVWIVVLSIVVLSGELRVNGAGSLPSEPGIGMLSETLELEALSADWFSSSTSSPMENIISCFFAILASAKWK